jgi:hypothetical protein
MLYANFSNISAVSWWLNNEKRQECISCNFNYSIKHVLIDDVDVGDVRQNFCNVNNLYDFFQMSQATQIMGKSTMTYTTSGQD